MARREITVLKSIQWLLSKKVMQLQTKCLRQTTFNGVFQLIEDYQQVEATYAILWATNRRVNADMVESQLLGGETTWRWIRNGRDNDEEGDIILILKDGKIVPSYLPEISDLALLPKGLKALIQWQLEHQLKDDSCVSTKTSIPFVNRLLWQAPTISETREWVWDSKGWNPIQVSSYLDTFKVITVPPLMEVQRIMISWKRFTKSRLDGRQWTIALKVAWRKNGVSRLKRYIVWNCKGMARSTFSTHMLHIVDYHSPDCIILTETRCSSRMAKCIGRNIYACQCKCSNAVLSEGGSALFAISDDVRATGTTSDLFPPKMTEWAMKCF